MSDSKKHAGKKVMAAFASRVANAKRTSRQRKRKAAFAEKLANNAKVAKLLHDRLNDRESLEYFISCFNALEFKECTRMLDENDNDRIDYLSTQFICDAAEVPLFKQWEWLLTTHVTANAVYSHGGTPFPVLVRAATQGSVKLCKLLLDHGARVNARGGNCSRTALMYAAANGHLDVCRVLVMSGANVYIEDDGDKTALILTGEYDSKEIVAYLTDAMN
jgi:ankyrin repeat protein